MKNEDLISEPKCLICDNQNEYEKYLHCESCKKHFHPVKIKYLFINY